MAGYDCGSTSASLSAPDPVYPFLLLPDDTAAMAEGCCHSAVLGQTLVWPNSKLDVQNNLFANEIGEDCWDFFKDNFVDLG